MKQRDGLEHLDPEDRAQKIPKSIWALILVISIALLSFLFWMIYSDHSPQVELSFAAAIPAMNAVFNALALVSLIRAVGWIRSGNRIKHVRWIFTALTFSTLFLIGYLIHHSTVGDQKFLLYGLIRYVYFFVLISHIFCTLFLLPMIFATLYLAWSKRWWAHKRWAPYTYRIWCYVSVTGILIFLLLQMSPTPTS